MITTEQSDIKPHVELEEVIDKLSHTVTDVDKYYTHLTAGTLNQYYTDTLESFAVDLMMIPIDRFLQGLASIDDPLHVAAVVKQASTILAGTFNKSVQSVEDDLNECVEKLPVSDYREAKVLRSRGQLN